jgi:hypothetical protein
MSVITQQHLASINRADRDLYAREKALNSAIVPLGAFTLAAMW